jgi:hypothetical protein
VSSLHNPTMKKISLLILFICYQLLSYAQGVLKGKIVDSTSKKPLGLATVTIYKAVDTSIISYRLSDPEGVFRVPGIPIGVPCRAVISFSGYAVFRKEFTLEAGSNTYDIDTVYMATNVKSLDEVLVVAERPPVVIRKDTIEFNASAFRTLPNALVEDLLKKLPGVMVDRDGNIVVNGKPVNRILVDGKTFFGDDPKMATRNLPANVIDKVQVVDDKDELMRNGDDNLNNVGKVINITLKKGVKKGWFGKLYAGAGDGNNTLYEAGGIANIYRDTLQVSVLGYMNNLNKPGFSFSELMSAGGFDRVRSNSAGQSTSISNSNSGSSISINGINFGGMQNGGGISTSKGAGFNLNHASNTKKSFFLQYFHGNVNADRLTVTDLDQYKGDTIVNNNSSLKGEMITHAHNIGTGMRLKPDSVTNILFNASYFIALQDEDKFTDVTSNNSKIGPLSDGTVIQHNDWNTYVYRHAISITRNSKKKKGRLFNFNHNLDIDNRFSDQTSESDIHYRYPVVYDSLYAQLRNQRVPRTDASVFFNYSEPLNKHFTFRAGGRYEYSKLNNDVNTYNKNNDGKFEVYNLLLSSDFRRISHRMFFMGGLEYKWKDLVITPSIRLLQQNVNNKQESAGMLLKQDQFNILPGFSVRYKQWSFNYSKDVILPGWTNLNPAKDLSNPYFIALGNPDLLPTKRHNLGLNVNINDQKRFLNVWGWGNVSFTENDVIQTFQLDEKGVQTTFPVNVDGTRSYQMNWGINKQYKTKQSITFTWNIGNWTNLTRSRLLFNNTDGWQTTLIYNQWMGAGLNMNDKFEWNISGGYNYNFTKYTSAAFQKLQIKGYNLGNELVLRWPKHLIWETQINYSYNGSIPAGMPKDMLNWNGALNITMLKDEVGVLKLAVYDILKRNNNIWVNANRNTVTTNRSNILGQYFLATFTYNVRAAGAKKKVGGRERLFLF